MASKSEDFCISTSFVQVSYGWFSSQSVAFWCVFYSNGATPHDAKLCVWQRRLLLVYRNCQMMSSVNFGDVIVPILFFCVYTNLSILTNGTITVLRIGRFLLGSGSTKKSDWRCTERDRCPFNWFTNWSLHFQITEKQTGFWHPTRSFLCSSQSCLFALLSCERNIGTVCSNCISFRTRRDLHTGVYRVVVQISAVGRGETWFPFTPFWMPLHRRVNFESHHHSFSNCVVVCLGPCAWFHHFYHRRYQKIDWRMKACGSWATPFKLPIWCIYTLWTGITPFLLKILFGLGWNLCMGLMLYQNQLSCSDALRHLPGMAPEIRWCDPAIPCNMLGSRGRFIQNLQRPTPVGQPVRQSFAACTWNWQEARPKQTVFFTSFSLWFEINTFKIGCGVGIALGALVEAATLEIVDLKVSRVAMKDFDAGQLGLAFGAAPRLEQDCIAYSPEGKRLSIWMSNNEVGDNGISYMVHHLSASLSLKQGFLYHKFL